MASYKNIGSIDRIVRGITGLWMVMDGLKNKNSAVRPMKIIAGGALIANSLTGHCAMLSAFNASSIPGTENNVVNQIRGALPGHKNNQNLIQEPSDDQSEKELSVV
jgi:hypothetical protein